MQARVIFMGTPQFAVPALGALWQESYDIVAVVTQPDSPAGRGKQMMPPPVKQFALSYNHFTEDHDEVIVLDEVVIHQDDPLPIGLAWCSHSKTLKKQELAIGNKLSFNGKIVKKKLPKAQDDVDEEYKAAEAVPYKINNPSKIEKQ